MTRNRRTNLREIAEKLGLSASTVSRALRDLPGIHPQTRQQVYEVAQALEYRGGEMLPRKRFSNILTLAQGVNSDTDHEYLAGMSTASLALNLSLLSHHYRPEDCAGVLNAETQPRALAAGQVDGIVLIHRWPTDVVRKLRDLCPVVSIIHDYPETDVDVISLDDRGGMDLIVGHLMKAGVKRVGFFGLCPEMTWARSRFAGWVEAMVSRGHPPQWTDIIATTLAEALAESEFSDGTALMEAVEMTRKGVQAWVCSSRMMALSLGAHLVREGIRIPRDVNLTSFHCSRASGVSLGLVFTSTEAPSAELGAAALRRIVHRIEAPETARRIILLPCSLRKGNSTKNPK
jgi:LacI family transcriptional regulator